MTHRCDVRVGRKWAQKIARKRAAERPTAEAVASWFDDSGNTFCETHETIGIANKTLACGTRVKLCHIGCEIAVVEDRGPFVAGREFDLNPAAKAGIGCSDLCHLTYRVE